MSKETNLREIERKAIIYYHQDGLLDIYVGVCILAFALWIWADVSIIPAAIIVVLLPIWVQSKRKFTIPRIGFVKFGSRGTQGHLGVIVGSMMLILLVFIGYILISNQGGSPIWLRTILQYGMIVTGLASLAICSLFGYLMGLRRLYAYGMLTLILFLGGYFFGIFYGYILLVLGTTLIIAGFVMLISFVNKYPLQGE